MGSAVTVGSGVQFHTIYEAAKAKGKIVVGGTGASIVAAGGYLQGAGHSYISPLHGLGADNALGTLKNLAYAWSSSDFLCSRVPSCHC